MGVDFYGKSPDNDDNWMPLGAITPQVCRAMHIAAALVYVCGCGCGGVYVRVFVGGCVCVSHKLSHLL